MIQEMQTSKGQQGATLIVTLVLMLIITAIASSAMRNATLQERMAGNSRDVNMAFQAAEAAIRDAERLLDAGALGVFDGSAGRYFLCDDNITACEQPDWSDTSSTGWVSVSPSLSEVNRQPEYYIEKYPAIRDEDSAYDADIALDDLEFYRITARGYGLRDKTTAVIQVNFRRQ